MGQVRHDAGLRKTTAPRAHRMLVNPQALGNLLALQHVRAQQNQRWLGLSEQARGSDKWTAAG